MTMWVRPKYQDDREKWMRVLEMDTIPVLEAENRKSRFERLLRIKYNYWYIDLDSLSPADLDSLVGKLADERGIPPEIMKKQLPSITFSKDYVDVIEVKKLCPVCKRPWKEGANVCYHCGWTEKVPEIVAQRKADEIAVEGRLSPSPIAEVLDQETGEIESRSIEPIHHELVRTEITQITIVRQELITQAEKTEKTMQDVREIFKTLYQYYGVRKIEIVRGRVRMYYTSLKERNR